MPGPGGVVVMPSKRWTRWHGFILDTRPTASSASRPGRFSTTSPRTACRRVTRRGHLAHLAPGLPEENINPAKATRLPLLFAIDVKLGIPGDRP